MAAQAVIEATAWPVPASPVAPSLPPPPQGSPKAAATAVAAAAMQLLLPKRKRAGAGMERASTMAALAADCNCHTTKVCTRLSLESLVVKASKTCTSGDSSEGSSAAAASVRCPYYNQQQERQRLYSWQEAPAALRYNKHIRSGYRAGLSYPQCCRSILAWHNETGNIWTHALPALLVLALLLGGQLEAWQGAHFAYATNVGAILLCFLGSVCYHTFMANHHHHDHWLKIDVCGVLLVLVGGGHMVLWWGMHCHPTARSTYALLYYGCGAACVWAALTATSAVGRGVPMLALLLVRLSAFVTRGLLEPPSEALAHYVAMEVLSLAGGLLNVLRIPERWLQPRDPSAPAPLDYLFNSHQIMHVLVAAAMWQLHLGATDDYHAVTALLEGRAQCPQGYHHPVAQWASKVVRHM